MKHPKIKLVPFILGVLCFFYACTITDLSPKASFECLRVVGLTATFTNSSYLPTTCIWDFGDGSFSTELNPVHVYNSSGLYDVKLIVSNEGSTDSIVKQIDVTGEIIIKKNVLTMTTGVLMDVDLDGIIDFTIEAVRTEAYISSHSDHYVIIKPANDFEYIYDTASAISYNYYWRERIIDTVFTKVTIPKMYKPGDIIQKSERAAKSTKYFCRYNQSSTDYGNSGFYNGAWIKPDEQYVGILKKVGDVTKIGWIKLIVSGYYNAQVISFKIPDTREYLKIGE